MQKRFAIKDVHVIPMPGNRVLRNQTVVVEDGKIASISPTPTSWSRYAKAQVIRGSGKYLIPGLFDMHVHLHSQSFFPLFLMNGVTAIREMGNTQEDIFRLKERVNSGKVLGPHMFICGPILEGDPPLWSGFHVVRTKIEARKAVKELKKKGIDFIKVYHTLKPDVYKAVLEEARTQNLKVVGHLPGSITPVEALELGQKELEHMDDIRQYGGEIEMEDASEEGYEGWKRFTGLKIDKKRLQKLGKALKKSGAFVCPTLIVHEKMGRLSDYEKMKESKEAHLLPKRYREVAWNPNHQRSAENIRGLPPLWFKNLQVLHDNSKQLIPFLAKHSILLAGSDTPNPFVIPGFSLIEELELLVEAGLKPHQALEAATYNASLFLKRESELGTVEEGKTANLVLLKKNPLQNISSLHAVHGVFLHGRYYSRLALERKARTHTRNI